MSASKPSLAKLGIDTASPVTHRFNFMPETDLGLDEELIDGAGLLGTFSHANELVVPGNRKLAGKLVLQPNVAEWQLLLPWILAGTPTGSGPTTYPVADAQPTASNIAADYIAKVFNITGAQVDKFILTGEEGKPLKLELDYVAVDVTPANAGTFPNLSIDLATPPFLFTQLVYTWGGQSYYVKNFRLEGDFMIDKERFFNSPTLLSAERMGRKITVSSSFGFGDSTALYGAGSSSGVHAVAAFTNGSSVLTFDMISVRFPKKTPIMTDREKEIMLPIEGTAYSSGATKELITTL